MAVLEVTRGDTTGGTSCCVNAGALHEYNDTFRPALPLPPSSSLLSPPFSLSLSLVGHWIATCRQEEDNDALLRRTV